jgi:hypothetical protein
VAQFRKPGRGYQPDMPDSNNGYFSHKPRLSFPLVVGILAGFARRSSRCFVNLAFAKATASEGGDDENRHFLLFFFFFFLRRAGF